MVHVPREPIFEKCPHLREKGGVLTLKTPRWVCAVPYSKLFSTPHSTPRGTPPVVLHILSFVDLQL
jgi:hypothetical protein